MPYSLVSRDPVSKLTSFWCHLKCVSLLKKFSWYVINSIVFAIIIIRKLVVWLDIMFHCQLLSFWRLLHGFKIDLCSQRRLLGDFQVVCSYYVLCHADWSYGHSSCSWLGPHRYLWSAHKEQLSSWCPKRGACLEHERNCQNYIIDNIPKMVLCTTHWFLDALPGISNTIRSDACKSAKRS